MKKNKSKGRIALEIIGILLALLWLSPFYIMLVNAFKTKREMFGNVLAPPKEPIFSNFVEAFQELDFLRTFFNSFLITSLSIICIVFFSAMAAYALSRNKSKVSGIIFFLFVASMLIPFQSVMIPLVKIFSDLQSLNKWGLIIMYIGFGSGLSLFLYHGALKNIPLSLDEAAKIDGATKWQTFWHVIFPLLRPIGVTVAILNVIWIWNDFLLPSLVLGKGDETIPLKLFLFFGQYTKQWTLALAGLTISIIPVIIGYFIAQKHIIKGVSDGAVK